MKLYHYTSLEALTKIIQPKGLCFLGSRYDSMNDPMEFTYTKNQLLPLYRQELKVAGCSADEMEEIETYPYIVSFSKKKDDFLMWRLYHSEVALVLDKHWLKKFTESSSEFRFIGDVKYTSNKHLIEVFRKKMKENKDATRSKIEQAYLFIFPFIKNKAFKNEEEVRIISPDFKTFEANYKDGIIDKEIPVNIDCRGVRNNDIILCKKFNIDKRALKGIILHIFDKSTFERTKYHLSLLLHQRGYDIKAERIVQTEAYPFRENK